MPCYRPIKAWQLLSGKVVFVSPGDKSRLIEVPCGKCIGCRQDRQKDFAVRAVLEASVHSEVCAITLTYNDEHMHSSLDYEDFRLFWRRLQNKLTSYDDYNNAWRKPLRFFMCGEYGTEFRRPHFHALVFGHGFYDDRIEWKTSEKGSKQYTSPTLDKLWGKGYATIGEFSYDTAMYIAKYTTKVIKGDAAEEHYESYDVFTGEVTQLTPEFGKSSNRPGIGIPWIKKYYNDICNYNELRINGNRVRIPRIFKEWIKNNHPEKYEDLKKALADLSAAREEDGTVDRLIVREHVQLVKQRLRKETLK